MNGLEVPQDVGISQTEAQEINSVWDTYDAMNEWLASLGFTQEQRPPYPFPELTEDDYVNVEGDDYSRLMLRVDKWFAYAKGTRSQLKGRLLAVMDEMDIIAVDYRQQVRQQYAGTKAKKPTVEESKDNIKSIGRYRELMLYEQNLNISIDSIDSKIASLERFSKGLSRQITLRGQEVDMGGRAGRGTGRMQR